MKPNTVLSPFACALLLGLAVAACSKEDEGSKNPGGTGGATRSGGSPGSGNGGATGTGGSSTGTGGSTSTGGVSGSAGSGGAKGGAGGAVGGSGGRGSDAAAEGGSPSEGGASVGVEIAGKLHKYVRTLKCVRGNPDDMRRSCYCAEADANRKDPFNFGGDPAVVYNVVVRIRGIVEPRGYTGGMLQDPANPWFYVGGMAGGPSDNRFYNQYKILVTEPKQVYYLNANSKGILPSSSKDHDVWKIDYKFTLKIKGGTGVDIVSEDLPSGMNRNFLNVKVDGVPMDLVNQEPNGFDGQFFYLEVESVTPAS